MADFFTLTQLLCVFAILMIIPAPLQAEGAPTANQVGLRNGFYQTTCPRAESIVRLEMLRAYAHQKEVTPRLLRLFFHDCFIKGCDASVLLDDRNGNATHHIERDASPNLTLRGSDIIDTIKGQLETVCPGVVSCAYTLALATRDGIYLAGGPFYPVTTGRKDSKKSYYQEALADIPKPSANISEILNLFAARGFSIRETVSLLGAHNVGKLGCQFFMPDRVNDFVGTGRPDPSLPSDFVHELRQKCQGSNGTTQDSSAPTPVIDQQGFYLLPEPASISSGGGFDGHYYQNLMKNRGVLFSDQQLMADPEAARLVRMYASEDGFPFIRDFARAMMKLSMVGVLTGTEGEVRTKCSFRRA